MFRREEEPQSCNLAIFSPSSSGEILATSGINEARVGASKLPKGPAEDMEQVQAVTLSDELL